MAFRFVFWMLREQNHHLPSVHLKSYALGGRLSFLLAGYFFLSKMSTETFGPCQTANTLSCHRIVFEVIEIVSSPHFQLLKCYNHVLLESWSKWYCVIEYILIFKSDFRISRAFRSCVLLIKFGNSCVFNEIYKLFQKKIKWPI